MLNLVLVGSLFTGGSIVSFPICVGLCWGRFRAFLTLGLSAQVAEYLRCSARSPLGLLGTLISPHSRHLLESPFIPQPSSTYSRPGHALYHFSLVFKPKTQGNLSVGFWTLPCEASSSWVPRPKLQPATQLK